jgi:hypothetical protein
VGRSPNVSQFLQRKCFTLHPSSAPHQVLALRVLGRVMHLAESISSRHAALLAAVMSRGGAPPAVRVEAIGAAAALIGDFLDVREGLLGTMAALVGGDGQLGYQWDGCLSDCMRGCGLLGDATSVVARKLRCWSRLGMMSRPPWFWTGGFMLTQSLLSLHGAGFDTLQEPDALAVDCPFHRRS